MSLEIFKYLNDAPEEDELRHWFQSLFIYLNHHPNEDIWQVLDAIKELSLRQFESTWILDEDIKTNVEEWVNKNWEISSKEYQIILLRIVSFLELKNSYNFILSKYLDSKKLSPEVKDQIYHHLEKMKKVFL